jgi:hypothetical protein
MFNLEKEIATWRQQMLAAGITAELLDELESHLRDEVDVRVKSGKSVEEAFMLAVQSMGQPSALQVEFAKNLRAPGFLPRLKAAIARLLGFPVPISKSFTAGARDALELGAMEARGFHHDFIGTEHVLLGLLKTETGVVPNVLRRLGVDACRVRSEIEKIVGCGPSGRNTPTLPYTPRVREALELARREASNQPVVGAEHIFLGLLREGSGVAAVVLKTLGVDIRTARDEVHRELGAGNRGE